MIFGLFHKHRETRYAGWSFVCVLALFLAISVTKPSVGLAGIGAVLVLGAIGVEANKLKIWEDYKANYKPSKSPLRELWAAPNENYYKANIYFVWPLTFLLGLASIYLAYLLA